MQGNTISGGCGGKRLCVPPYIIKDDRGRWYYWHNGQPAVPPVIIIRERKAA